MDFFIVNAFTDESFGGNTAGVVIYESCSEALMQKIASELKFSETAFIKQLSEDTFSIKYFTPNSEVELCGHATIASFKVLQHIGLVKTNCCYRLKTKSELLAVYLTDDYIFMESGSPKSSGMLDNAVINKLAGCMNINSTDIGDLNFNLKPQIVTTGLYDIILPVKSVDVLNNIKPDFKELSKLSEKLKVVGVHAFTLESNSFTARCRNFAPLYAINEEAATGTSNASLTYYLYINNIIHELDKSYVFVQGELMGRASNIITKLTSNNSNVKILVGGSAAILSEGRLLI